MNALLPLLHALVVVIAIGAVVAASSPRAAVIQPAPSTSKHGLDSTQIQVTIVLRVQGSISGVHGIFNVGASRINRIR